MSARPLAASRLALPLLLGAAALSSEWLRGLPGEITLYLMLGAFPGLAVAWLLIPRASATTRWTLGLALAPLVSSVLGWCLMRLGVAVPVATRAIGLAGWLAWTALELRTPRPSAGEDLGEQAPGSGWAWALSLLFAFLVALPYVLNPWMLVKSDAWNHAGIVWNILERGVPPEDPRFAGLPLNYVWFFNLFIALLTRVHDQDPFVFMAIMNVVDVMLCAWVAYLMGWMLWRRREAATGTALLMLVGFSALTYLLWPLRGLRAIVGQNRGWQTLLAELRVPEFRSWRIMEDLSAPFSWITSFLDKFLTGTSIHYAWLMMMLFLWAMVRLMRGRHPGAWTVAALGAAGMLLYHGVVGLSVIPVACAALVLALLLRARWNWLPGPARLLEFGAAVAVGSALAAPYTWSISRGWTPERTGLHISRLHFEPQMMVTVGASTAVALWIAWRPATRAVRERVHEAVPLILFAAGIYLFAILVALPNKNESKFAFEVFVPLAVLGGASFLPWLRGVARARGGLALGGVALLFLLPHALTVAGFTLDPTRWSAPEMNPAPGETELYAWMRRATPANAVFVDHQFRDLIMVRARRQLYLGSSSGPERAGFPLRKVIERRAVMADLYGPAAALDADATALTRLGRPVYVLVRRSDFTVTASPRGSFELRADLFTPAYDRDGFVVYHVTSSAAPAPTGGNGGPRP